MARVLVYTSPARGHLFPLVPTLRELQRRGHQVALRTLRSEVDRMRALGFAAAPIAPEIEAREIDDWKASSPPGALLAACRTFVDRARHEVGDLRAAIAEARAELLFTDINCWGAAAAAEASGIPWAVFSPYFLPVRAPGIPAWGLGLAPRSGALGRLRDALAWRFVRALFDRVRADLNRLREDTGVTPFRHVTDYALTPPRIVYYTAEPFEYPRAWPAHIRMVGPGIWEPPAELPFTLDDDDRPLVLVTCSTEFQDDGDIIATALAGLADEPVRVVATAASVDAARFRAPANARVERYLPHGPLLERAACVVCHGGMGITQKALAAGVPACVIPFGRDQLEVARHVEVAGAGVRLLPKRLTPDRIRDAVRGAMAKQEGARRIAQAFRDAGGPAAAASALEELAPRMATA
jgi:MGT family glycosyltransferase